MVQCLRTFDTQLNGTKFKSECKPGFLQMSLTPPWKGQCPFLAATCTQVHMCTCPPRSTGTHTHSGAGTHTHSGAQVHIPTQEHRCTYPLRSTCLLKSTGAHTYSGAQVYIPTQEHRYTRVRIPTQVSIPLMRA